MPSQEMERAANGVSMFRWNVHKTSHREEDPETMGGMVITPNGLLDADMASETQKWSNQKRGSGGNKRRSSQVHNTA